MFAYRSLAGGGGTDVSAAARPGPRAPRAERLEPRLLLDGALLEAAGFPPAEGAAPAFGKPGAMPELQAGVRLEAVGTPIDVGTDAAPAVADWNNDGKKDLLVGQEPSGRINRYLNVGTDADPILGARSYLLSAGTAISTSSGG